MEKEPRPRKPRGGTPPETLRLFAATVEQVVEDGMRVLLEQADGIAARLSPGAALKVSAGSDGQASAQQLAAARTSFGELLRDVAVYAMQGATTREGREIFATHDEVLAAVERLQDISGELVQGGRAPRNLVAAATLAAKARSELQHSKPTNVICLAALAGISPVMLVRRKLQGEIKAKGRGHLSPPSAREALWGVVLGQERAETFAKSLAKHKAPPTCVLYRCGGGERSIEVEDASIVAGLEGWGTDGKRARSTR